MAKWRLLQPHYLNVPGTDWEYKETDRTSGRQGRKVFDVPLFLNPNDMADCNRDGEIIVTNNADEAGRGVHHFLGEPTPDMEPCDDEARKISASLEHKWRHPIDTLPANGDYSQALFSKFESQLGEAIRNAGGIPNAAVPVTEFEALKRQVAELVATNAALQATLVTAQSAASATPTKRV